MYNEFVGCIKTTLIKDIVNVINIFLVPTSWGSLNFRDETLVLSFVECSKYN